MVQNKAIANYYRNLLIQDLPKELELNLHRYMATFSNESYKNMLCSQVINLVKLSPKKYKKKTSKWRCLTLAGSSSRFLENNEQFFNKENYEEFKIKVELARESL